MRYETLRRNGEFARAYSRGKSYVHSHVVMYVNKNRCGKVRIGLTATKKIGKATVRNRAKRVMKAALNNILTKEIIDKHSVDIVLVSRALTPNLKSTKLENTIKSLMEKAGIC